jgi:hypothetical protein
MQPLSAAEIRAENLVDGEIQTSLLLLQMMMMMMMICRRPCREIVQSDISIDETRLRRLVLFDVISAFYVLNSRRLHDLRELL